jgi:nucleoside-diphosphate-sugar epimerase
MAQPKRRIDKGGLVLVTGANGYIASHVVDVLLEQGYRVRGSVRAQKTWLNDYFDNKYGTGKFETVIIPHLEDEGAFQEAVRGVSGVAHVVSPPVVF